MPENVLFMCVVDLTFAMFLIWCLWLSTVIQRAYTVKKTDEAERKKVGMNGFTSTLFYSDVPTAV